MQAEAYTLDRVQRGAVAPHAAANDEQVVVKAVAAAVAARPRQEVLLPPRSQPARPDGIRAGRATA